jgi:hypothetical protein
MDALSVSASIVGLLTAAGKTHALLETISSIRNAPTTIKDAQRETRHTEVALRSLNRFLQHIDPTNPRLEMIQVDELRVVLADAMMIFDGRDRQGGKRLVELPKLLLLERGGDGALRLQPRPGSIGVAAGG